MCQITIYQNKKAKTNRDPNQYIAGLIMQASLCKCALSVESPKSMTKKFSAFLSHFSGATSDITVDKPVVRWTPTHQF